MSVLGSLALTLAVTLLFSAPRRRFILLSACCASPAVINAYLMPGYWDPILIWKWGVGLEDVLTMFTAGGLSWLLASWPYSQRLVLPSTLKLRYTRFTLCLLVYYSGSLLFWLGGLPSWQCLLAAQYLIGLVVLGLQRQFWLLAAWGGLSYLVVHVFWLKGTLVLWPHFLGQWQLADLGGLVWGIPLTEWVWAFGIGFTIPQIMAFIFDVRLARASS